MFDDQVFLPRDTEQELAFNLSQQAIVCLGAGRRLRIWLANSWPNFNAHWHTVSWLTRIPWAASISSTIQGINGNRNYNQTAGLMTSAGRRWQAKRG